jgi:hypothetical protein
MSMVLHVSVLVFNRSAAIVNDEDPLLATDVTHDYQECAETGCQLVHRCFTMTILVLDFFSFKFI